MTTMGIAVLEDVYLSLRASAQMQMSGWEEVQLVIKQLPVPPLCLVSKVFPVTIINTADVYNPHDALGQPADAAARRPSVSNERFRPGLQTHELSPTQQQALFAQFQLPGFNYHILPFIYETRFRSKATSMSLQGDGAVGLEILRDTSMIASVQSG